MKMTEKEETKIDRTTTPAKTEVVSAKQTLIEKIKSKAKPVPERRRKSLAKMSPIYAKYGFTTTDAVNQGFIVPAKDKLRDSLSNKTVNGFRARSAPDSTDPLTATDAVEDFFNRLDARVAEKATAPASEQEEQSVWASLTNQEKRKIRNDERLDEDGMTVQKLTREVFPEKFQGVAPPPALTDLAAEYPDAVREQLKGKGDGNGILSKVEECPVKAAKQETIYAHGDKAVLTGKTEVNAGVTWEEYKWTEGNKKGKTGVRMIKADRDAMQAQHEADRKEEQEGFAHLHKNPENPRPASQPAGRPSYRIVQAD